MKVSLVNSTRKTYFVAEEAEWIVPDPKTATKLVGGDTYVLTGSRYLYIYKKSVITTPAIVALDIPILLRRATDDATEFTIIITKNKNLKPAGPNSVYISLPTYNIISDIRFQLRPDYVTTDVMPIVISQTVFSWKEFVTIMLFILLIFGTVISVLLALSNIRH